MKRTFIFILGTLFLFATISAFAVDGKGNARKGKRIWKKNCRVACHDGSVLEVPDLSPVSKTQAQWKDMFTFVDAIASPATTDAVASDATAEATQVQKYEALHKSGDFELKNPEKENLDMFEYLHGHALDSDQPETCG